jgi:hypothetical protein
MVFHLFLKKTSKYEKNAGHRLPVWSVNCLVAIVLSFHTAIRFLKMMVEEEMRAGLNSYGA